MSWLYGAISDALTSNNPMHDEGSDPEPLSQFCGIAGCPTTRTPEGAWGLIETADRPDVMVCESGHPRRSALQGCIPRIIRVSAEKQVAWSHAWRIVATMQHILARWYGPVGKFPPHAGGRSEATSAIDQTPDADFAVPPSISGTLPFPAAWSAPNFLPESNLNGYRLWAVQFVGKAMTIPAINRCAA